MATLPIQIRDRLLQAIRDRGLRPGDQIPTEAEIIDLFDVSRSTVREALRLLEHEGLIWTEHGRGRFLAAAGVVQVERPIDRFESVTEMLNGLGYQVTTSVLSVDEDGATQTEAQALGLEVGGPVLRIVRLRYGDERLLLYTVDTVPRECLPGSVAHRDWSGSLIEALALQGHPVDTSAARIRAVELPPTVAERHALGGLGPWLLVEETCVSRTGRPVLLAHCYHRGGDIAFHVVRRRP